MHNLDTQHFICPKERDESRTWKRFSGDEIYLRLSQKSSECVKEPKKGLIIRLMYERKVNSRWILSPCLILFDRLQFPKKTENISRHIKKMSFGERTYWNKIDVRCLFTKINFYRPFNLDCGEEPRTRWRGIRCPVEKGLGVIFAIRHRNLFSIVGSVNTSTCVPTQSKWQREIWSSDDARVKVDGS